MRSPTWRRCSPRSDLMTWAVEKERGRCVCVGWVPAAVVAGGRCGCLGEPPFALSEAPDWFGVRVEL
jgi:hypothetical protein